jgi:type IV pilus assembly protein PilQ
MPKRVRKPRPTEVACEMLFITSMNTPSTFQPTSLNKWLATIFVSATLLGLVAVWTQAQEPAAGIATPPTAEPMAPTPVPEEAPGPAVEPAATQPTPPATAAPDAASAEPESDVVVIDYNEADIKNVMRTLATRAGVNLILGDEVAGSVTVHLEGVGYEEAMRLIVESKGFAFVKDKNVVRVKTKESLDAEPIEARVVSLNYAKAEDVKTTLENVVSKQGKIQVDVRSNTLILTDTPSSLTKVLPLIDQLDTQTPQVLIEAKFVETTKNPKKDLGINWSQTLLNHQVTAGGSAVSENPGDPPKIIVDDTGKPVSGFQWAKPPGGSAVTPWTAGAALLDAGRAAIVFSFLSQDSDSELLANPRVVTTDNGKAKIAIATQYPIPQFTYSETKGAFSITGFEYKDIGIVLNVTPRINRNDFVTLEVAPEAGSQSGVANLQGVFIPVIDNRTAQTTVLIKSGNTLAIGGLMRQDSSDSYTKVPVLGDMPGIGALFRSKSLNKMKRDLLIFLTPTIITPESQTGVEQFIGGFPAQDLTTDASQDNAKPNVKNLNPWRKPSAQKNVSAK